MPNPRDTCAAGTLRRATRSVSRLYDSHLARAGLTTTQFSLLRSLAGATAPVALTELAEQQVLERTSLYRTLEPLRREKLIAITSGRGRAKMVSLTESGAKRVATALPHWQRAQEAFLARFGSSAWGVLAGRLVKVVKAAAAESGSASCR